MTRDDMNDMEMQSLMSLCLPPTADDVGFYLAHVGRALGVRSDSQIAGCLGLPPASIANWKRRRKIPGEYHALFGGALIEKIIGYNRALPAVDMKARLAIVLLIAKSGGNPLNVGSDGPLAAAESMGGLLALSQFILDRMYDTYHNIDDIEVERLVELLKAASIFARNADHLRKYANG